MPYETRHRNSLGRLNVENLTILESVLYRPRLVVQLFDPSMLRGFDRPLGMVEDPTTLYVDCGFAIRIYNHLHARLLQTLREMSHEQLGSTIICRGHRNEGRRDQCDFHRRRSASSISEILSLKAITTALRNPTGLFVVGDCLLFVACLIR